MNRIEIQARLRKRGDRLGTEESWPCESFPRSRFRACIRLGGGRIAVRWVGIDEAGYGPNLGPLVMTAVVAEAGPNGPGSAESAPPERFWDDLQATVRRAGRRVDGDRFWVDDSKAILKGGKGREQLTAACLAVLDATGLPLPIDRLGTRRIPLRRRVGVRRELDRWMTADAPSAGWARSSRRPACDSPASRLSRLARPGGWRRFARRSSGPSGSTRGSIGSIRRPGSTSRRSRSCFDGSGS